MHKKRGLRTMVVSQLSSAPKNGAELMNGIEAATRGWWRPTPGSIYPLLTRMVDEGTLKKRSDGKYELTPEARREVEVSFGAPSGGHRTIEGSVSEIHNLVSYIEDANRLGNEQVHSQKDKLKELAKRLTDLAEAAPGNKKES
jgi:DNA-binding PadR family transcriptional regulator